MSNSSTFRRSAIGLAGAAAINAVVFTPLGDEWFFAIVLFGPIVTGIAVALARGDLRLAAVTWAGTGLFWLVLDWIINQEDVAFHAVLAVLMAALVMLGGLIARPFARRSTAARAR